MKLPGLGASVLIIIVGIVIFYVPGVMAQILYLNGTQSTVTCADTFCVELVLISFLGILTIILGAFLTVIAFLNRPRHKMNEEKGSVAASIEQDPPNSRRQKCLFFHYFLSFRFCSTRNLTIRLISSSANGLSMGNLIVPFTISNSREIFLESCKC